MSQPAAPAATMVTTLFLLKFGRLSQRRKRPIRSFIPSHPLCDLESKPPKGSEADDPEKDARDHGLPLLIYMMHTTLSTVAASNELLKSNPRAKACPVSIVGIFTGPSDGTP
jgi:hypothetical protein